MDHFYAVLENTISPDNEIRSIAEKKYDEIPLDEKATLLTQLLTTSELLEKGGPTIIVIALVFLRKLIGNSNDLYNALRSNDELLYSFKTKILEIVELHAVNSIKLGNSKKLADILTDTCLMDDKKEWPESLNLLLELDKNNETKPVVLQTIISFPPFVSNLGNGRVVNLLAKSFNSQDSIIVNLAARATCSYLVDCEPNDIEAIMGFGELIPNVMNSIVDSVVENDDDSVIKQFIDVVECEKLSPLLKNGFNEIITLSLKIIANERVNDENKQLALEVVISLVETFPALIRKLATKAKQNKMQDPIEGTIQACLHLIQMVNQGQDEKNWLESDKEDDTDLKSNTLSGEAALDRLACALRGGIVLPRITNILPELMNSELWQSRYAGLTAISAIAEGCHSQMSKALPDILSKVLVFTNDSHGRVRYATANCLGQLAIDFGEKFTKMSHKSVVPALCNLLDDNTCPKVIGQSAAALVNFVESLPTSILISYSEIMINKIQISLDREASNNRIFTLQQLVTLLAAIAGQLDDKFIPYFINFMPGLNQIIQSSLIDENLSKLRGKAIECYSIIGLAVGKENFSSFAKEFMDAMLNLQLTPEMWDSEDETISYTISAWARMCKILGEDFSIYLPKVMPPLLKACKITPEVAVVNDDENIELNEDQWQMVRLPGDSSQLGIKTSGLELKATACSMLVCYCKEVGNCTGFGEYIEEVLTLALDLLKFYFHEDVRIHAGEILASIVDHHGLEPWKHYNICSAFISAIETDPDETVIPELMDLFAKCIEDLLDFSNQIFKEDDLHKIFKILGDFLKAHIEKTSERQEIRNKVDHDDGDEEEVIEAAQEDEYLLQKIADVLHAIFGTQTVDTLKYYSSIHQYFEKLIDPSNVFSDRQWAICVFDDIIERCGPASLDYSECFLKHLVNGINDSIGEIRQACAYGIGVLAKACNQHNMNGTVYDQALLESVNELHSAVNLGIKIRKEDDTKEDSNEHIFELDPWENAISAIGKIMRYKPDILPLNNAFDNWLDILDSNGGIQSDNEEAQNTFEWLLILLKENPEFMHENGRLTKFVSLVGDLLVSAVLDDEGNEIKRNCIGCMSEMVKQNQEAFNNMTSSWDENKKFLMHDAIEGL